MFAIYRHEVKTYFKGALIWAVCVGGLGFACILLFSGMQDSMEDMADSFAAMGAFSDAFGMSQLSIATLMGFYATEVGTIHALGGAMFAAIVSTTMLSKEEDGHTSEFLFTLPVSRGRAVAAKWCAIWTQIVLFNLLCVGIYLFGVGMLGEEMELDKFLIYHLMQFVLQLEIAACTYAVSAFMHKNKIGIGVGIVLLLYVYDLIARVIPDLTEYKAISPFSYANAADIFSTGKTDMAALCIGVVVLILGLCTAFTVYSRKDLT